MVCLLPLQLHENPNFFLGYLTNTNIKIMAIIKDTITTSQQIAAREMELKLFFVSILIVKHQPLNLSFRPIFMNYM